LFNYTQFLIDHFVQQLQRSYEQTYGGYKRDYSEIISWAGGMALENIANSDALYHNVEHTILVTMVGQEILRGKHIYEGGVSCEIWLNFTISLVCHDIGYLKGLCREDDRDKGCFVTGRDNKSIMLTSGETDASLAPYHVDRGKLFIDERFKNHAVIDAEEVKRNMELTRFPVPLDEDHKDTMNCPGLVRAADLIGQLSDPRYLQKISALFYEFEEIGANAVMGFKNPGDLRQNYPRFYWNGVHPYITEALHYLDVTQEGKQVIANLFSNVFRLEHSPSKNGYLS